jgi:hypothetical protein
VAVPVQRYQSVLGSLVLSTRGGEIDTVLRNERKIVLFTFVVAALVAILLSVALAAISPSRSGGLPVRPNTCAAASTGVS